MSVDLGDLIDSLKRDVTAPGQEETLFPAASEDSWLGRLQDAFWSVRLDGMLVGFVEADGIITPTTVGDDDLTRDLQQLIILYAGIGVVRNELRALNTTFRAKAGPVEYETGKSAQLLKAILDDLKARRDLVLVRLSDVGAVPSYYIDALVEREYSIDYGLTYWVGQ